MTKAVTKSAGFWRQLNGLDRTRTCSFPKCCESSFKETHRYGSTAVLNSKWDVIAKLVENDIHAEHMYVCIYVHKEDHSGQISSS